MVLSSKGSKGLNFERNHTQFKFKLRTVEKNQSTIGLLAGIELTLLHDVGAMLLPLSYRGS